MVAEPYGMLKRQARVVADIIGETMSSMGEFDEVAYMVNPCHLESSERPWGWVVVVNVILRSGEPEVFTVEDFNAYRIVEMIEVIKSSN